MNQQLGKNKNRSGDVKTAALDFKGGIDFIAVAAQGHTLQLNATDSVQWRSIGSSKYLMPHPNHILAWLVGSNECLIKGFRVGMPILRNDGEIVAMPVDVTNTTMNQFNVWAGWWRAMLEEQEKLLVSDHKEVTDDQDRES